MKHETQTEKEATFWQGHYACKAPEPEIIPLPFRAFRPFVMGNPYPVISKEDLVA